MSAGTRCRPLCLRLWRLASFVLPLLPAVAIGELPATPEGGFVATMRLFGGRPLVPVTINGHGPYDFIVDTGAAVSLVDETLAADLGLEVVGSTETGSPIGPPRQFEVTETFALSVGPIELGRSDALLFDFSSFLGSSPDGPRGVLSYLAFGGWLIVYDYPGRELRVSRGALDAGGANVFSIGDSGMVEVPITLAGHEMRIHVDTGSPGSITLPLAAADELPLTAAPVITGSARTVNAEFDIYAATLDGVAEIGPYRLEHPELTFIEDAPVGNLGYRFLSNYVVTLDPARRRLRLESPQRPGGQDMPAVEHRGPEPGPVAARTTGGKRYGLRFAGLDGDVLQVIGTDRGSAAEQAGIGAGDVVVSMNGVAVMDLDRSQRIGALRGSPLVLEIENATGSRTCTLTLD